MLAAINLDDQPLVEANKIRDIPPDRNLAAKLERREPAVAQRQPQFTLGIRHLRAQLTGYFDERPLTRPAPAARATLSRRGRGFNLPRRHREASAFFPSPLAGEGGGSRKRDDG
jgi:hypothetical protein